jgi:hypothetical protein
MPAAASSEQSHFFENSFLVSEGLIDPDRFVPMFGIYSLAEAVNILCERERHCGRYGKDEQANQLAYRISAELADSSPVRRYSTAGNSAHCCTHSRASAPTLAPRRAHVCLTAMSRTRLAICWPSRRTTRTTPRGSATF